MRIFVRVKTNAKNPKVEKVDETHFGVSVKESPKENKANLAVLKALADYFKVSISRIRIVFGATSRNKIIEIQR
jgi:uncharacterized protein YggU (UPF0235/DUF167 family)